MNSSLLRLRVSGRRAAVVAAVGAVALVAAGCASFVSPPTGAQLAPNGAVEVTSNICLDSFLPNVDAADLFDYDGPIPYDASQDCGSSASGPAYDGVNVAQTGQFLIAYLVPDGSGIPSSFTSSDLTGVTFSRSSDYETWLAENETTPSGYEWAGYMSSSFYTNLVSPKQFSLTTDFTPPAGVNGQPYAGPYVVKNVVIGDRLDTSTVEQDLPFPYGLAPDGYFDVALDPGRALDCNEAVSFGDTDTVKAADVQAADVSDELPIAACDNESGVNVSIATRDLTVVAPTAAITAQAGSTATVPFTVEYNGPSADPFMLSASTNSNALVPAPVNPSFTPSGTGNTTENVTVAVPAGLTPGNYTVTLNVGAFGSTPATLNVTAPPPPTTTTTTTTTTAPVTPQQTPTIGGLSVSASSLKLSLTLNIAATERLTLARKQNKRWHTLKTLSLQGSAGSNTIRLKSVFGSLLKDSGRYRITVQAFNGTLSSAAQSLTFVES